MRLSFVTVGTQTNRRSSVESQNTTEQMLNKTADADDPSKSWPLFWHTRKRGSSDEPPFPFIVECISQPEKVSTIRLIRGREVLKNVRKLLSRIPCLTYSRAHPVGELQVFMEVHREIFCDSEWDVVSPQEPLGYGRAGWDNTTKFHSNLYRHKRVRLPTE